MNMFKPTSAKTPEDYIAQIDEPRRTDIVRLHQLIQQILPDAHPWIGWGMLCYGKYTYKYASGRVGEWSLVALASQKNYISLYVSATRGRSYLAEEYKGSLPKANIGKSCIRFKRLDDVDIEVLREIIETAAKIGPMSE
jgi:hypothetical protein